MCMRKKSREMDASWALEVMDKAPYITVSMSAVSYTHLRAHET